MSALEQKITQDLTEALKSKQEIRVSVLRMLKAALQTATIAKMSKLSTEDDLKVVKSEVKKRQDSITSYRQGNREDLASKEEAELEYLKIYLPPEISDEDLQKIIDQVFSENSFSSNDFGQAMKAVMAASKGQADGSRISALVKQKLSS